MKIHREGRTSILIALGVLITIIIIGFIFNFSSILQILTTLPLLVIFLLVIWFFRVPARRMVLDPKKIIAPADGKIVVIENVREEEYFKDERIQISIFMSPLNVHQNVYPADGEVCYTRYHKGDYLVAWHPKSSTQNERATIVIKRNDGIEILIRQIAGALARRICSYSKVGDKANQAQELGFIKFGSRVDIFLPVNAKILCELNQKSVGKQTILAEL